MKVQFRAQMTWVGEFLSVAQMAALCLRLSACLCSLSSPDKP